MLLSLKLLRETEPMKIGIQPAFSAQLRTRCACVPRQLQDRCPVLRYRNRRMTTHAIHLIVGSIELFMGMVAILKRIAMNRAVGSKEGL
jgi:hypothetical protein